MEESEKNLLENIKNFDTSRLLEKNTYAEIQINDSIFVVYILDEKGNQKCDIFIQNGNKAEVSINYLNLLGENDYSEEKKKRDFPVNNNFIKYETTEVIKNINKLLLKNHIIINSNNNMNCNMNEKDNNSSTSTTSSNNIQNNNNNSSLKQDKNGKIIDISGYMTFQLLQGFLLDCISIINNKINNNNFTISEKDLLTLIINIIIYLAKVVKANLDKYKTAYYNRRLLIVSQIHAILVSFDSLLFNLTPNFDLFYSPKLELDKKLPELTGLIYEIIIASKNKNQIPLQCLLIFIKLIYSGHAKESIENYNKKEIYEILNGHMKNLDKNELLYFKKDSQMREKCNSLVSNLFDNRMDTFIDETYYSYLLSCLKCNNLEKKINALSDINNLIIEFQKEKKINNCFKDFIEKNKILDIFFDENTHEELIKRCTNLFSYMAKYNCLSDNIIEKIIQRQSNNELMKKILIEIISGLPKEKKNLLFNRLSQGLKFDIDNTNNIEYILNLTKSCFESSDIESDDSKEKEKDNDNDNDIEIDIVDTVNYYGLNTIFDYIIKDFDDKKRYDENNVDIALNNFVDILLNILKKSNNFNIEDIFFFIEQLFENIKFNSKHNSIIQSIKIIHKLFNALGKKKYKNIFMKNLKNLDEKYDIITLLINDLIRYMKILPNNYSNENGENNIYEGIYPHYINVEQRLNLILFFFKKNINNYGLILEGKKHLEKIYEVFKFEKFKNERKKFFSNITKNINLIDNTILIEFYQDILKNKEELDLKEINDNESTNLIIQTFKQINFNKKSILDDGRNIRVVDEEAIEGIDMLFDLLTQNLNQIVQEKISQLLCDVCLSHKNYNNEKISDFWKNYFNKINLYLDNIINANDKIALTGIIKLFNKIYFSSCNCYGKIPNKRDIQTTKDKCYIYNFIKVNSKKEWRHKVGINDKIIDLRWRIGCHFDIPVNNVAFIDIDDNIYTLNNDFEYFIKIFSDEKYLLSKGFEYIKIKEIKFALLEMKDNPKFLIENNDKIYNILINNLKIDLNNDYSIEISNKQKIWNFISKLPKKYYFENKLKKYGNKEKLDENELLDIFDINQIYLLTYSLQCFYYALFDSKNKKNEKKEEKEEKIEKEEELNKDKFLRNFIEIYHIDKVILNKLLEIQIDINYCYPIQIECLRIIIEVLYSLEKFKENQMDTNKENILKDENLYNNLLKKMTEIIPNLLRLDFNIYKCNLIQDNDDLNDDEDEEDKDEEITDDINDNFETLIKNIFSFIDVITKNKKSFPNFIFDDKDLFIKIFINDYIISENKAFKKVIDEYLLKKCEKNNETLQKYLEIILTEEIFNYIIKNDESGKYFQVINTILNKIFDKKDNKETESRIESKHIEQAKKLIDIILNYIQQEFDNNDKVDKSDNEQIEEKKLKNIYRNKESLKEGIILFLSNILNIENYLVNYLITKVDICDFFLHKCVLRKCVDRPLEIKEPFCLNNQSKGAVFTLLLNILRNLDIDNNNNALYMKIIEIIDNMNKLGFWKTFNTRNWEIESKDIQKGKYIGLKNMTSTCYLNSIIQQLFMIPTFRETILKIENNCENNVLYELQLLFSALKIFEFPYYNPKSFVLINNLNFYEQMDADEYYGSLIDKIEKDIKKIFSKIEEIDGKIVINKENYKYKDIFNYFFGIKVLDELKFVDCGHKRFNEFCYNNIQLEIKDFNNIQESLKNYFRTEVMDGDNKINCEQCNTKRTCHKHLLLKSLPNILVICLKRFEFDYDTMLKYKLNKYFEFPLQLEMKDYLIENHTEKNTEYELTGITIHFGVSDFGHYYDLIKAPNNKWYKFNDTNVNEFNEEDIAREAFGEKEISEDDSDREKENGRNNAYILFYTKKGNEIDKLKNEKDLALPPYSKYSNIKKDIIDKINTKLFKSWILNNIFSFSYQNFVMGLLKIDLAKMIDSNVEKMHPQITRIIRNEGYMKNIKENKDENDKKKDIFSDKNINNNNDKIFQFGLRYYYNVILRISKKNLEKPIINNINRFKELIIIYMETDIKKAEYILEEFSNSEAIEEYFVYCPVGSSSNDCYEIITHCIDLLCEHENLYNESSIIYLFLNTYTTFIYNNYWRVNLQYVIYIFYRLIKINENIIKQYLVRKNINKWAYFLIKNEQTDLQIIFNEKDFPTINSNHSILTDKTIMSDDNYRRPQHDENDIYDQHFYNKTRDSKYNLQFREELKNIFFNDRII